VRKHLLLLDGLLPSLPPALIALGAFFCPSVFSNFYKILEGIEIGVFGSFSGLRGWGLYFYTVWVASDFLKFVVRL
jgi:hypothetical protein